MVEGDTRKEESPGPSSSLIKKEPPCHAVKVFYGESTASEEEAKEKEKARPKVASPRKHKVGLCHLKLNSN